MPRSPLVFGALAGLTIAAVDHVAAGRAVGPIAMVALLLAATATAGARWSWRGWIAAVATWAWIPIAPLVTDALGWADSIPLESYGSIVRLGLFTAAVSAAGFCGGVVLATAIADPPPRS